jgi:hypothetical protein
MQKRDIDRISAKHVKLARSWDDVLTLLKAQHSTDTRVAIYPYATMQHQEVELDG